MCLFMQLFLSSLNSMFSIQLDIRSILKSLGGPHPQFGFAHPNPKQPHTWSLGVAWQPAHRKTLLSPPSPLTGGQPARAKAQGTAHPPSGSPCVILDSGIVYLASLLTGPIVFTIFSYFLYSGICGLDHWGETAPPRGGQLLETAKVGGHDFHMQTTHTPTTSFISHTHSQYS